jgi:predicted HTH transcriptional regulator
MNNLEQILGSEEFLRISRSTIVQKKQIEQINGSNVVMREFANEKDKLVLSVDISYSEIVEQFAANKALTEEGQPEPVPEEKRKKNINQDFSLNQRAEDIYHYILSNPNSKIKDIANAFDISYRSVTRYLTFLKENGLIKYSGAKRNGGYKVVSRRRKIKKKQNRQSE